MDSYGEDEYDRENEAGSWNQYDSYALRRGNMPNTQIHMTQQMTTKIPPPYDGRTSFFAYEDAIDDWCDVTELEPEKRGPALRNRLEGEAAVYKRLLGRDLLRDPNDGVNYFKRFLRPHFSKGAQNVFLFRFMQFMKQNRGTTDLHKWMTRFQITGNRLMEPWMDLLPDLEPTHPDAAQYLQARRLEHEADQAQQAAAAQAANMAFVATPWNEDIAQQHFNALNDARRTRQRRAFPMTDNLLGLIFVSLADLSQDQRNTLTSIMTHRGRPLEQYTVRELRETFLEMFCTTRTAVDNPMMQPSAIGQRRSFLVIEEGELEGTNGYWAEDEEDGAEGFLDALEDVFWVYDDVEYTWFQRRFQGRNTRKGKGKGKRKGKGKGRGGRRFFRPRRRKGKGKGRSRKGRSHMVGEDEYEEDDWNTDPYEGYPAEDTWNDGYWASDDLYYLDEYGYFQRKGKGKSKGKKGKKGKDDEGKGGKPGDGKGKSNYVQPSTSSPALPAPQAHYTSAASSSDVSAFVATARTDPVLVDMVDCEAAEPRRRTRRGGQNRRDQRAEENKEKSKEFPAYVTGTSLLVSGYSDKSERPVLTGSSVKPEEPEHAVTSGKGYSEKPVIPSDDPRAQVERSVQPEVSTVSGNAFAFHNTQTVEESEIGISFHSENKVTPTVCILDLGCTRAMGSRRAVEAFCRYVDSHPEACLWYEFRETSSRFFFANSQQSKCTEKLVVFMYDYYWNKQRTEFDIVEEGDVPLLMSLPQMRNLGFQFELTPENAYLSCSRIGMRKMSLKTANSTHLILDLQDLAWYMSLVDFRATTVKSFYATKECHFEYGQLSVDTEKPVMTEAYFTQDYWQVDSLRRELIRHHRDFRRNLHDMEPSKTPIPKENLKEERETHIEYKNGKKVIEKDKWTEKKKVTMEGPWKGKTIYKIEDGYEIPKEVSTEVDKARKFRGDIDDLFQPEPASSKPSSFKKEVGKKVPAGKRPAKRHVGKQKAEYESAPSKDSSKELSPHEEMLDFERELEESGALPKPGISSPDRSRQDSESRKKELGSDSLEPRRLSVPLPGSEVQAMTPAFKKMLKKLEDKVELYKLHVKHYHMSPTQFRRRTSMLGLPDSVYEKYEDVVHKRRVCSTSIAPPPRARVSGIRASNFGDVIFVDHAEIKLRKNKYIVLLVLDGATKLLWLRHRTQ